MSTNKWPVIPRHYGKGEQIVQAEHHEALVNHKRQAKSHNGQHRLQTACPQNKCFCNRLLNRVIHCNNRAPVTASSMTTAHKPSVRRLLKHWPVTAHMPMPLPRSCNAKRENSTSATAINNQYQPPQENSGANCHTGSL